MHSAQADEKLQQQKQHEKDGISSSEIKATTYPGEEFQTENSHHQSGENKRTEPGWTPYLLYSMLVSVLGTSFMYGFNSCVVNAPFDVMSAFVNGSNWVNDGRLLNEQELHTQWSIVVSLFVVGGCIGSCWFPDFFANRFGRMRSLLLTAGVGFVGGSLCFISVYTGSYIPLMVGRTITGLHSGVVMVIIPALLVELAPLRRRGACGSLNELTLVTGVVFSNLVGLSYLLGTESLWQFLFLFATLIYAIHAAMLWKAAESPRWLIDKNRYADAIKVLRKLRNTTEISIRAEFEKTKKISVEEASIKKASFFEMFRSRELLWPLIISINLHFSQQLTGIGAVMYYASQVMTQAGLDDDIAKLANFAVSIINIVFTIISAAIVDRVGRRLLMLIGVAGIVISHIVLTIVLVVKEFYVSIAGFAIFLCFFSLGPGPIPWFMTAEMFAQSSRPMALSICLFVNWITNLAVGLLFPLMQQHLGHYAFMPFGIFSFVELVFLFLFLPETCRIPLEEVVEMFKPGRTLLHFRTKCIIGHSSENNRKQPIKTAIGELEQHPVQEETVI